MDHFPTVGHLKCTVKAVYIKSSGGQKGGSLEPPEPPLPTGLEIIHVLWSYCSRRRIPGGWSKKTVDAGGFS